jgi:hypothetical protein
LITFPDVCSVSIEGNLHGIQQIQAAQPRRKASANFVSSIKRTVHTHEGNAARNISYRLVKNVSFSKFGRVPDSLFSCRDLKEVILLCKREPQTHSTQQATQLI